MIGYTILGGKPHQEISLSISGELPVSLKHLENNHKNASALGLPRVERAGSVVGPLYVVGGGPSIQKHVEQLRAWTGEIWAINGAWGWCKQMGVKATFLAVDPHPIVSEWCRGAEKAILATVVDPSAFDALKGKDVRVFDLGGDGNIRSGSSTATCAPHLGIFTGHAPITLFGCESSYQPWKTHAYVHEDRSDQLIVECGGQEFMTAADFYQQAQELSEMIREFPDFLKEESGGLLRAMVQHKDFRIKWVSEAMAKGLKLIQSDEPIPFAVDMQERSRRRASA